jgi:transmembrane sensor
MKDFNEIISLIRKDLRGELSEEETSILNNWAGSDPAFRQLLESAGDEQWLAAELKYYATIKEDEASTARMLQLVQQGMEQETNVPVRRIGVYKKRIAAAAIAAVLSLTVYLVLRPGTNTIQQVADIDPGSSKATLTLSNGDRIELNTAPGGIVTGNEQLRYADSSMVPVTLPEQSAAIYNSLSTPRGGQYRIVLPDGTKVWLNAETTLKYPGVFAKDHRTVELEGEAYFEVAQKQQQPFIVKSKAQELQVLGTAFNISAYPDEPVTRTTLASGAVQVKNLSTSLADKLQPGLQSEVNRERTIIRQADVFSATAWKSGLFSFRNASVEELMKQLRRWYGVEVEFEGAIPPMRINGEVDRNMSAAKVFEVLDYLDIQFRITNNKIIISNKPVNN